MSPKTTQTAKNLIDLSEQKISSYREHRQKTGLNFNIFKLLDRYASEVKGHSAFIAEFLNPLGMHGQGDSFLKLFFKVLKIEDQVSGHEEWQVHVETAKDIDGRIDILLIGENRAGNRTGIAIENKIYAKLQDRQLGRYYDYLQKHFGQFENSSISGHRWFLFYLTLHDGDKPTDQSIGGIPENLCRWKSPGEKNSSQAPVRLMSYSSEITKWMQLCCEKLATIPYVRETVSQYLETIDNLTGNGGNMPSELEPLLNSSDKLEAAVRLAKAVELKRVTVIQDIWAQLEARWGAIGKAARNAAKDVLLGDLHPNDFTKKYGGLKEATRKFCREIDRRVKKEDRTSYFGLCSGPYIYEDADHTKINVFIEIRFDGNFYVGVYGKNGSRVLPKDVVKAFYDTPIAQRYLTPKGDIKEYDRVLVKDKVDFTRNTSEFFALADSGGCELFAKRILGIASSIIKEMGLNYLETETLKAIN